MMFRRPTTVVSVLFTATVALSFTIALPGQEDELKLGAVKDFKKYLRENRYVTNACPLPLSSLRCSTTRLSPSVARRWG